jgi:hypothetical protein
MVDPDGQRSLLDLLEAMRDDGGPNTRTIAVTTPSSAVLGVPANPRAAVYVPSKVRLSFDPSNDSTWNIAESASEAVVSLGRSTAEVLVNGLHEPARVFDVVLLGDPQLWFWGVVRTVASKPA